MKYFDGVWYELTHCFVKYWYLEYESKSINEIWWRQEVLFPAHHETSGCQIFSRWCRFGNLKTIATLSNICQIVVTARTMRGGNIFTGVCGSPDRTGVLPTLPRRDRETPPPPWTGQGRGTPLLLPLSPPPPPPQTGYAVGGRPFAVT